ncbi:MAG: hypothetical protein V1737_04210 [Chloroflexota bacterium]
MGRKLIPEEDITEWVRLRRKGQSFRSIAKTHKVDARTVQAWVRRAGEEKEKEHWEAVSRQVDAGRLDEHYRLLLQVAAALLQVVRVDPLSVSPERSAQSLLEEEMLSGFREAAGILKGRGLDLNAPEKLNPPRISASDNPAHRLGRKLLQALFDHEPPLKTAFDIWASHWTSFQQARLQLVEIAGNLFRQKKVPDATADALKVRLVREALDKELFGKEVLRSRVEQGNDGLAALIRYNEKTRERLPRVKGSKAEMDAVAIAYDGVLTQVSLEEIMRPIKAAHQSVLESFQVVEDLLDELVLVGRPRGHCSLCPQYAADPVKSRVKKAKPGSQ